MYEPHKDSMREAVFQVLFYFDENILRCSIVLAVSTRLNFNDKTELTEEIRRLTERNLPTTQYNFMQLIIVIGAIV